jgi:hypothetical protein
MGIKSNEDTFVAHYAAQFNCEIDPDKAKWTVLNGAVVGVSANNSNDPTNSWDYSGNNFVYVIFKELAPGFDNTGNSLRFYSRLEDWNLLLQTDGTARANMAGRYLMLMRYRVFPDPGETRIGVTPVTFWDYSPDTYLDSLSTHWIQPYHHKDRFQVVELGEITIGPNSYDAHHLYNLDNFCIGFEARLENWDGVTRFLYVDKPIIIPAEHYIKITLPDGVSASWDKRVEVVTGDNMEPSALIAHTWEPDGFEPDLGDLTTDGYRSWFVGSVDEFVHKNWILPESPNTSSMVVCTDGNNASHSNVNLDINFAFAGRSRGYF